MPDSLKPYAWLIDLLLIGALIGAGWIVIERHNAGQQRIGYDRAVGEYRVKQLAAEQTARQREQALTHQLEEARNEATRRDQQNRAAAAAAAAAHDSLRHTNANLRQRIAGAPAEACRLTADAALAVFDQCATEYRTLAEIADRHANDAQLLSDAWPTEVKP